jgi:hypothetical protein
VVGESETGRLRCVDDISSRVESLEVRELETGYADCYSDKGKYVCFSFPSPAAGSSRHYELFRAFFKGVFKDNRVMMFEDMRRFAEILQTTDLSKEKTGFGPLQNVPILMKLAFIAENRGCFGEFLNVWGNRIAPRLGSKFIEPLGNFKKEWEILRNLMSKALVKECRDNRKIVQRLERITDQEEHVFSEFIANIY